MKVHQETFVSQLLHSYGLDSGSMSIAIVAMALPDSNDVPPTPTELKVLQKHAGELNWLATRTRLDLSYYVSVLASVSTQHGAWALQLAKKVLRYLLGTTIMWNRVEDHKELVEG